MERAWYRIYTRREGLTAFADNGKNTQTEEEAIREAEQLAALSPGVRFFVAKVVAIVMGAGANVKRLT